MFSSKKFSISDEQKKCLNCVHARPIPNMREFLCGKKGIVGGEYSCKKHDYDITKLATRRKHSIKMPKINPEDLQID